MLEPLSKIIDWDWENDSTELDEISQQRIWKMLKEGYIQGELHVFGKENQDILGFWCLKELTWKRRLVKLKEKLSAMEGAIDLQLLDLHESNIAHELDNDSIHHAEGKRDVLQIILKFMNEIM
jgi:hypothetical protein